MNATFFPNDAEGVFQCLHLPDFGITWAGANPFGEGFCLGSEAGHLVLTDTKGRPLSLLGRASASGEAISGVAFSRNWLAVTTRKDINLHAPLLFENRHPQAVVISGGAPDVAVAPSGYFVLPVGRAGIMFVKPGMREDDPVTISNSDKPGLNFCRLIALPGEKETDLIVCAARRGGLGFTDFQEGIRGHTLHTVQFHELDIVDVCSIASPGKQWAVAAAGRDGSLVLFHDILTDKNPLTVKFKGVKGAVYRVLSAGGDIYLLTSNGLFALSRLGDNFLSGLARGRFTTDVLRLPIEAADANLVDQRWLVAVGVDELFKFDLAKLPRSPEQTSIADEGEASWTEQHAPEMLDVEPLWEQSGFEQTSERWLQ